MMNWKTVPSVAFKAVQEYVDDAYDPRLPFGTRQINWARAEKAAHENLDKRFGHEVVQMCLDEYKR